MDDASLIIGEDNMVRGIRGAITVRENDEQIILKETERLLREIIDANNIDPEDVSHVIVTVTNDLNATFPAKALRNVPGWTYVPVMCATEIPVPNSLEKCIRLLLTVNTNVPQKDIQHIYLEDAVKLRPDLHLTKEEK